MGERFDGDGECPCEAEVADLDVALIVDKEVLRLEVPVDDSFGVAVVNTTEELVNHFLNLLLGHCSLVLSHKFLQIILNKFKNEIKLLLVGLKHDFFEATEGLGGKA